MADGALSAQRGAFRRQTVGPRQTRAERLRAAERAFSPTYVLPESLRKQKAGEAVRATQRAVERLVLERGFSTQQAKEALVEVGRQIQRRDVILGEAGRRGFSRLATAAALRKAGIPKALLRTESFEYVTLAGRVRVSGRPGGERRRGRVSSAPGRAPTPIARRTPTPGR